MPFGESFLTVIKNNKSIMLDKSRRFRKTSGGFDWSKGQQFDFPKSTPEELKRIRQKLKQENRQIRFKQILVLSIIMLILISTFVYLIN